MPSLVSANEALTQILELFSPKLISKFSDFVLQHNSIFSYRYPLPHQIKHQNDFIFLYEYIKERNLIIITGFKQQKDPDFNFALTLSERRIINQITNCYLDNLQLIE